MRKFCGLVVAAVAALITLGFSALPAHADTDTGIIDVCVVKQALCIVIDTPPENGDDDPWV